MEPVTSRPDAPIAFTRPWFDSREEAAVREALAGQVSGDGPIGRRVEARLAGLLGASRVLLTTSGTHALELALLALGIGPGQEVVCPSFTFVSSANAVLRVGARPVFADIEEHTLGLDPADVERRLTPRTSALLPVHYAGVAPDMEALLAIARRRGLRVVEDAAQGLGATWRGRALGTLGDAGCLSFHETKNITCGEGGALVLADPEIARRAEIAREKGTNRAAFLRGEVDKYTWVAEGSSYVLSDVLAAILDAQLDKLAEIQALRAEVVRRYREGLGDWAAERGVRLAPELPERGPEPPHLLSPLPGGAAARRGAARAAGAGDPGDVPLRPPALGSPRTPARHGRPDAGDRPGGRHPPPPATAPPAGRGRGRPGRGRGARDGVPRVSGGRPHLSLVLACYNEAEHLLASFAEIRETLERAGRPFEVIFVDDVSRDGTRAILQEIVAAHPHLDLRVILHDTNRGRGATVTDGFRAARGEICGYLDVDLEVHCRYVPSLVQAIEKGADVATVRRIYALQLLSLDRYFMTAATPSSSAPARRPRPRHRDRLQVLPPRDRASSARRDRGRVGSGTPSSWCERCAAACGSSRSRGPTSAGRTRPRRSGDCATPCVTSPRSSASAAACGPRGREGARRDRLGARFPLRLLHAGPGPLSPRPRPAAALPLAAAARGPVSGGGRSCTTCASSTSTGAGSPASTSGRSASWATSASWTSRKGCDSSAR